jgi:NAD(P)-dependent dehydrogenase (short-subunit alcohol dehydrogenase family)
MRLKNKIAVITGAGSGMGRAMAELFATEGAKVVCADVSGNEKEVAASIGGAACAVHADVSREEDVRNMIEVAEKTMQVSAAAWRRYTSRRQKAGTGFTR